MIVLQGTLQEIFDNVSEFEDGELIHMIFIKDSAQPNLLTNAVVLAQKEENMDEPTTSIAEQNCPGYKYLIEISLVKETLAEMDKGADKNFVYNKLIKYYLEDA
jgi:hypothetical protein